MFITKRGYSCTLFTMLRIGFSLRAVTLQIRSFKNSPITRIHGTWSLTMKALTI